MNIRHYNGFHRPEIPSNAPEGLYTVRLKCQRMPNAKKNAFRHAPSRSTALPCLRLSCILKYSADFGPLPLKLYECDDKSLSLTPALSSNASTARDLQPHRGPPPPNLPLVSHKLKREASQPHTTALEVPLRVYE